MRPCQKRNVIWMELSVSCAISLFWVGLYGYHYDVPFFNSPFINWLAFLLWSFGLFVTLQGYRVLSRAVRPVWARILLLWIAYFSVLLVIEYFGYHVLRIRLVTSEGPLLFGLIHGTLTLKIYYIVAGIGAVMLSSALKKGLTVNAARERALNERSRD